jgi:hypothetical protein
MKLKIEFSLDNSAFEDENAGSEVARILYALAGRIESYHQRDFEVDFGAAILDINGNRIGEWVTI